MTPEPRKRTRKQAPLTDSGPSAVPVPIEAAQGRRRRNTATPPRPRPGELVDFAGAARRVSDRAERVNRLKEQLTRGAYRADPLETARAMERRSDA